MSDEAWQGEMWVSAGNNELQKFSWGCLLAKKFLINLNFKSFLGQDFIFFGFADRACKLDSFFKWIAKLLLFFWVNSVIPVVY